MKKTDGWASPPLQLFARISPMSWIPYNIPNKNTRNLHTHSDVPAEKRTRDCLQRTCAITRPQGHIILKSQYILLLIDSVTSLIIKSLNVTNLFCHF